MQYDKFKPALHFNWWEARAYVAMEDIKSGDILTPCGVRGAHPVMQKADCREETLAEGPLVIARHDTPGVVSHGVSNSIGLAFPWLILVKGVDTTGRKVHDLVFLGEDGKHSFEPGKIRRVIGKVLRVGPASKQELGEADCGAIYFDLR